jgi:hypothetical protein
MAHIFDPGKSAAGALGEAQPLVQACDPAIACTHMN